MIGAIDKFAEQAGLPSGILKTAIVMILSVFLSPLYRLFPTRIGRNWLSILIGFFFVYIILEQWAYFILASHLIPYWLCTMTNRPFFVSVGCSALLLLLVHGYRFVITISEWEVDLSLFVMVLVPKLTYFGQWLQKQGNHQKISIIDYLGYQFFFPCVIAGPSFNFGIYLDYLNQSSISFRSLNILKALNPFFISLPLSILMVYSLPIFPTRWALENDFYLSLSFYNKILIMNIIGFFYRLKYYSGWYIAQGAVNLSGLSEGKDGQYNKVVAISLKFETEVNPKNKTQYWNTSNQQWLRNLVYAELVKIISPNASFFGTFLVSAFWHGLYLSYYLGFILWGLMIHINKWVYKWSQAFPRFSKNIIIQLIAFLIAASLFSYIGMTVVILNWDDVMAFHSRVNHWGTITLLALTICSFLIVPPKIIKQNAKKRNDEQISKKQ